MGLNVPDDNWIVGVNAPDMNTVLPVPLTTMQTPQCIIEAAGACQFLTRLNGIQAERTMKLPVTCVGGSPTRQICDYNLKRQNLQCSF